MRSRFWQKPETDRCATRCRSWIRQSLVAALRLTSEAVRQLIGTVPSEMLEDLMTLLSRTPARMS